MGSFEPLTPQEAAATATRPRQGRQSGLLVSTLLHAQITYRPWENVPAKSGYWHLIKPPPDPDSGANPRHVKAIPTTLAWLRLRVNTSRYLCIRANWTPEGELNARLETHGLDPAPLDQVQAIVQAWETFIAPDESAQYTRTRGRPKNDPDQHIEQVRQAFHRIYNPKLPAATHGHTRLLKAAGIDTKRSASVKTFQAAGTTLRREKRKWVRDYEMQKRVVNSD